MSEINTAVPLPTAGEDPDVEETVFVAQLEALLARAAELAAAHGVPSEAFMSAAWNAHLDARPGLREELADKELKAQLRKLRKRGLIASA